MNEHHQSPTATEAASQADAAPSDPYETILTTLDEGMMSILHHTVAEPDPGRRRLWRTACLSAVRKIAAACDEIIAADDAEHAELVRQITEAIMAS